MVSSLDCFCSRVLIPLFTGDLTAPTGRALRSIYEKRFICHLSSPP
jgi:hypothetical protein